LTTEETYELAVRHHNAGRFPEAETLYGQVLDRRADHAPSLQRLGVLRQQQGRPAEAVELILRAINIDPTTAGYHCNLGTALAAQGSIDDAVAAFERALQLQPKLAAAWSNLGNALRDAGRVDRAIEAYRRAIALDPHLADAHNNLGVALNQKRRHEEAAAAFERAVSLRPDFVAAYGNLGEALRSAGKFDQAVTACRKAVALDSQNAQAHGNLGTALAAAGRPAEALAVLTRALDLNPLFAPAHNTLGTVFLEQKRFKQAADCFRRALAMAARFPEAQYNLGRVFVETQSWDEAREAHARAIELRADYFDAHRSLGASLRELGRSGEALECFQHAAELRPDRAEARFDVGYMHLLRGNYERGWTGYEARWEMADRAQGQTFGQPRWDGCDLAGRCILLWAEQGFGTLIQFVRFAPLVAARGGQAIVQCPVELRRLFQTCRGINQIIEIGKSLPEFDVQCALPSIAAVTGTTLAAIPSQVPYLSPDPSLVKGWESRISREPGRLKIGLNWAGNPRQGDDRHRSFRLETMAPLAAVNQVRFFSLQKGIAAKDAQSPPSGLDIVDWTMELGDFADTAALMSHLDLVITSDTSVAHLAGALGKPVWVALKFAADWRWLEKREDSPWYPTMRLFRQPRRGDWPSVFTAMAAALRASLN